MRKNEVQLTFTQHIKVLSKVFYEVFPVRLAIIAIIMFTIFFSVDHNFAAKDAPGGVEIGIRIFFSLMLTFGGYLFLFVMVPQIVRETKEYFGPIYQYHKEDVQAEALNKVDDQLLK